MSLRETVRVIQPGTRRLKIFVDFWNVVINARKQTSSAFSLKVKWDELAEIIISETKAGYHDESTGQLAGCYIFGSFRKSDAAESGFIEKVLDEYGSSPGLFFDFRERISKTGSVRCDSCKKQISTSSETGVDVLLTVEMIKHAAMRDHEYLSLVSSDRDFVPLLTYFRDQGQRVVHVSTSGSQREMRSISWKQIDLRGYYGKVCGIDSSEYLILTIPGQEKRVREAVSLIQESAIEFKIIDLTDKEQITDRDLRFMVESQHLFLKQKTNSHIGMIVRSRMTDNMHKFREDLSSGEITGNFPFVLRKGQMEAYAHINYNWIIVASDGPLLDWRRFPKA